MVAGKRAVALGLVELSVELKIAKSEYSASTIRSRAGSAAAKTPVRAVALSPLWIDAYLLLATMTLDARHDRWVGTEAHGSGLPSLDRKGLIQRSYQDTQNPDKAEKEVSLVLERYRK